MSALRDFLDAREEIAEEWLLYYQHRKRELDEQRRDIIDASSKPADAGKSTVISQVAANKAIRLSRTWNEADWLAAVEYCFGQFSDKQKRLLQIRWHQVEGKVVCNIGRSPWIEDAILHYADQTGEWPETNTVSRWWREMVVCLSRWAESRGCYK